MKIAVLKERRPHETRVAVSPEVIKKFRDLGLDVTVETEAGSGAGMPDEAFRDAGATIAADAVSALKGADIVLKVQRPVVGDGVDEYARFTPGQVLICHLAALSDRAAVEAAAKAGITSFAMELMPRISRAQSMDILSSQANLAGYRAVLDAAAEFGRSFPMMMTAAGTVPPARAFVMGVGVAGLQAIATAKRLGAVVSATDVRPATKEQVESLGASFVAVEDEEFRHAQTAGGYAKEMSAAYKEKQAALVAETIRKQDIVICTALIPGRPAPRLVSEDMVKSMKQGSVIVDLAVEAGGNCALSQPGEVVVAHGVKIVGHLNMPGRIAEGASNLFARNIYNFLAPMIDKEGGGLKIDLADELVAGTLVTRDGAVLYEEVVAAHGLKSAATAVAGGRPAAAALAGKE